MNFSHYLNPDQISCIQLDNMPTSFIPYPLFSQWRIFEGSVESCYGTCRGTKTTSLMVSGIQSMLSKNSETWQYLQLRPLLHRVPPRLLLRQSPLKLPFRKLQRKPLVHQQHLVSRTLVHGNTNVRKQRSPSVIALLAQLGRAQHLVTVLFFIFCFHLLIPIN